MTISKNPNGKRVSVNGFPCIAFAIADGPTSFDNVSLYVDISTINCTVDILFRNPLAIDFLLQ